MKDMQTMEKELGLYDLQSADNLDPLCDDIGHARYVLLGEASHGTHEFYTWRTAITKRLVETGGFSFIAVEGDWPDCYRINRYVKGYADSGDSARDVLRNFKRWPTWMWANWEIAALMEWLREFNLTQPEGKKVGFYGLDVYSLWESMDVMIAYLKKEDPHTADLAMEAVRCFEPYEEGQDYAQALLNLSPGCTDEVVNLLRSVKARASHYDHDPEAPLNAEMNAQVIANAEQYFRAMVSFRDQSWNIRDAHMVTALDATMRFHGPGARGIVWEHNTHVGDARYTDMKQAGLWNVGQLVRERHQQEEGVYIVGFATYAGTVIAARSWGAPMQRMDVPPARPSSVEHKLHQWSPENKLLLLNQTYWRNYFKEFTGHRAIGVIYHPEHEHGNYVPSQLAMRYDALLYIDQSKALHPLHLRPHGEEMPETYPFGF